MMIWLCQNASDAANFNETLGDGLWNIQHF